MLNGDLRKTCASIDVVFAFAMVDENNIYVGRDPIGVRPLFYGFTDKGSFLEFLRFLFENYGLTLSISK